MRKKMRKKQGPSDSFPRAQESPIMHWFFNHIWTTKGKNVKPVYVFWLNNPTGLCFTPALLKSELFPDKLWFGVNFEKDEDYFGALGQLKSGFAQKIEGNAVEFKLVYSDNFKHFLIFMADYHHEMNLNGFVKVVPFTSDNIKYS